MMTCPGEIIFSMRKLAIKAAFSMARPCPLLLSLAWMILAVTGPALFNLALCSGVHCNPLNQFFKEERLFWLGFFRLAGGKLGWPGAGEIGL